jgi:hypothetical protein
LNDQSRTGDACLISLSLSSFLPSSILEKEVVFRNWGGGDGDCKWRE